VSALGEPAQAAPGERVEPLFSAEAIAARVEELSEAIASSAQRPLLMEVILNGAVIFGADLMRSLSRRGIHLEMDFIALSSYDRSTQSSGEIALEAEARGAIAGRDVLLIDDILETGRTLSFAKAYFASRGAARVMTSVLLDKSAGRDPSLVPDFIGFSCPDRFAVGYGMDYAYRYRELPYIGLMDRASGLGPEPGEG